MLDRLRIATAFVVLATLLAACAATPVVSVTPSATIAMILPTPTPERAAVPCTDCWPLSGRAIAGGDVRRRPLVVKLDNGPAGRPQYGINTADMVVETLVEGYVTRLAAIFHSREPERFASVRSGRLTDRSITPMVRGALVYSGSSAYADALFQRDAAQGKYVSLSADHLSSFYRGVPGRVGPYDMYTTPADMRREIARVDPKPVDVPRWSYLPADHSPTNGGMVGSLDATTIVIPYREDVSRVSYTYDPASRTYARTQNVAGKPVQSVDALDGKPIAATNVVIIGSDVHDVPEIVDPGGNVSNDTRLVGVGAATIFRDGLRREAIWSRQNDQAAFTFRTATGDEILLAPGQTWVHPIPSAWEVSSAP